MKKIFIFLLTIFITAALWAADFEVDGIAYNVTDAQKRTVEVTNKSTNYSGSVTIPSSVTYSSMTFSVTSIGNYAFASCDSLTSINIPNSVTSFGYDAFYGCSSLTSIFIPNSVISIEDWAFANCSSLTSITIPNSVTRIEDEAFYYCTSLTSVTIPNSVISIGSSAFEYCSSLSSITIPNSVVSIESWAFANCTSLTSISIPKNVTSIGYDAFNGCTSVASILVECVNPPTLGTDAFKDVSHFIPVYVPKGSKALYQAATGWDLFFYIHEMATFPYTLNVQSADEKQGKVEIAVSPTSSRPAVISAVANSGYIFSKWSDGNTENPRTITITQDTTLIAYFYRTNVLAATTFTYSTSADDQTIDGITVQLRKGSGSYSPASYNSVIRLYAKNVITIKASKIKTVYLTFTKNTQKTYADLSADQGVLTSGGSSTAIDDEKTDTWTGNVDSVHFTLGTYGQRVLKQIVVEAEGGEKFVITYTATSKLSETSKSAESGLHINAFNVSILSHEFSNGTGTITFAGEIKSVGDNAFRGCDQLTSITIPNNVTKLGKWSFCFCPLLQSISMSNSIDSIEYGTFMNCSSLSAITIPNSVISIGDCAFYRCNSLKSISLSNNLKNIGIAAFDSCVALSSISIPHSVVSIGPQAFGLCNNLSSVTIPENVTKLGMYAFYNCTLLKSVSLSNKLDSIEYGTFMNCSSLSTITIPNSVTSIGEAAFYQCLKLTSVSIPNSVKKIGKFAFLNCSLLKSVSLSNTLDSIEYGTFSNCSALTTITIPNSVTNVGDFVFYKCTSLKAVSLSTNLKKIGSAAFDSCIALPSITIPNSVTSIGPWAFFYCTSLPVENNLRYADTYLVEAVDNSLSTYTIKESTKWIGNFAFYYCTSLSSLSCYATTPPTCIENCFYNVNKSIPVYVPAASITAYQSAYGWKDFTNYQPLAHGYCGTNLTWQYNQGTLAIKGTGTMYKYSYDSVPWLFFRDLITNIIIDNGATSIGDYAFYGCGNKNFKTLDLPNSVITIGQGAFANCTFLKNVTMGTAVEDIGAKAFDNDQKLLYVACYTLEPPTLANDAFANWDAYLSVPCEAVDDYKVSTGWKLFTKENIRCIGTEPASTDSVITTPTENSVVITWPTTTDANEYTIEIKKDGVVFCTLTFNAQGQLTNIAFAPGRGESNEVTTAEAVKGGYKFTITSLTPGTKYTYNIDTKDAAGTTIKNYTGEFMTKPLTALEETSFPSGEDRGEVSKFIRDNQLLIHRDGKTYNAQGAEVR